MQESANADDGFIVWNTDGMNTTEFLTNTSQSNATASRASSPIGFLFTKTSVSIKFAFFMLVFVVGTVGNCFMAYVIWKNPQLRSRTNLLLAWLIYTDILVGFNMTLFIGIYQFLAFVIADTPCQYIRLAAVSFTVASISVESAIPLVVAIAIERYVAICHPFQYVIWITDRWAKGAVAVCWSIGFGHMVMNAAYLYKVDFTACKLPWDLVFQGATDGIVWLSASVTMILLYGRILMVAIQQRSKLTITPLAVGLQESAGKMKLELKAAKTTAFILGSMVLLWFPYILGKLLQASGDTRTYTQYLIDVGLSIGISNHALDWFIYGASSRDFRNAMKKTLKMNSNVDEETSVSHA